MALGEGGILGAQAAIDLVGRDVVEAVRPPAPQSSHTPWRFSTVVPLMLVWMKASGPSIERSTWLSAAKWTIVSMP